MDLFFQPLSSRLATDHGEGNAALGLPAFDSLCSPFGVRERAMVLAFNLWQLAREFWHIGFAGIALLLSVLASGHAVLHKRDTRAVIAWVGFVWLVPFGGAALYFILGVNRIRRQAASLRSNLPRYRAHTVEPECSPEELHRHLPGHA